MNTGQFSKRLQVFLGSTLLTLGAINTATAAPGTLTDKPLFVGSQSVKPNIMFLIDDSGSMGYGTLFNKGVTFVNQGGMNSIAYIDPGPDSSTDSDVITKKLMLCAGYNVMAYNPKIKYLPWKGKDKQNKEYADFSLTTAVLNPYYLANVSLEFPDPDDNQKTITLINGTDISHHVYYEWDDKKGDGVYEDKECSEKKQQVSKLDAASQSNYANWFSYYRTRELAMKAALSNVVTDSSYRMGFKTLHNNAQLTTTVSGIDFSVADMSVATNKSNLLDSVFKIKSDHGTPLRGKLKEIGEYYRGANSPILGDLEGGQCQRNFAVVMSDGYWNGDVEIDENKKEIDTLGIGNVDGDAPHPYGDVYSNTLADVAYLYYDTDLKTNIANKVPALPGIDEKTTQHMVTYTVAFGVSGSLPCDPVTKSDCPWEQPIKNTQSTVDDMYHAAVNGRGKFLSASNPQLLMSSLNSALTDISAMSGTLAPVTFNTTSLLSNSLVYQAEFDTSGWRGDLTARLITKQGLDSEIQWSAATILNAKNSITNRKFYTFDGTDKVDFAWTNLTTDQQADLLVNTDGSTAYGDNIVAYLKGDHSNEGTGPGQFRARNNQRLGDIVHSGPTYVGVPNASYPDDIEGGNDGNVDKRYSTFVTQQSGREGLVYVGANDGALHAFNSLTGEEEFAYIPSMLFSSEAGQGLHALAEPAYDHNYYVDLSATAADVYINNAWRTVIVGGLRGGGKGVFALDVTDEDLNDQDDVLFEFTDANLGYTYSEIQVAKMNNGKWAAIFGNGYNNNGDGKAKLFIVYLDTGASVVLDTGVGTIANFSCDDPNSDCNGLSTPALGDLNGDNIVDRLYAGDVHGNVWAFDVSSNDAGNWGSVYKDTDPFPLFIACRTTPDTSGSILGACPAADRQPITSKPSLAWHPTQHSASTAPNILVFFGTGQFLTPNDLSTTDQQNFYGVWDRGVDKLNSTNLQLQTVKEATYTSPNTAVTEVVRVMDSELPVTYSTKYGWNIQLPTSKERVVVNPTVYGDLVFFSTLIPGDTATLNGGNPCDGVDGGSGWLMAVKLSTGGQPDFASIDLNRDYYVNGDDALSDKFAVGTKSRGAVTESRFIGNQRVTPGDSRAVRVYDPNLPPRSSWTVQ